jgi:uncharacterized protein
VNFVSLFLTVIGLAVFETVSSVDNAVVNADVLSKMTPRSRRWFLTWGIFISVILVRGLLPWLIILVSNPHLGFINSLTATFSNDPTVAESIKQSSPILLIGGGVFLIFLFFHWLFLEEKNFGLRFEPFFTKNGIWFFAFASTLLASIIWTSLNINPLLAFGAAIGSSAFFLIYGFREQSAKAEMQLSPGSGLSDISKLLYLEVLDATFSLDGVIGAFAFTFSVPLIILGNGLGAIIVRQLTIRGVDQVKHYLFLKNGAMYSILVLGFVMLFESLGVEIPFYFSPLATIGIILFFFLKSIRHNSFR